MSEVTTTTAETGFLEDLLYRTIFPKDYASQFSPNSYFNRDDKPLLLTIGGSEYSGARRFIDSVPEHCFQQLCTATLQTISIPNRYNVQNEHQMTFLFGLQETQEFIEIVAEATLFIGLVSMLSVCIPSIGFYT